MLNKKYLFFIGYNCASELADINAKENNNNIFIALPDDEYLFPISQQLELRDMFEKKFFIIDYKQNSMIGLIDKIKPDVVITMGWRRIIGKEVLELGSFNINIHPAVLPNYKGYHTEPYVIQNNEASHGITAHVLTHELDAGDILHQELFEISDFSTVMSLKNKVKLRMPYFVSTLIYKIDNNLYKCQRQDPSQTKVIAKKRMPEDSEIDSRLSLNELYNYIRSCDPKLYPAFFYKDGKKIFIKMWTNDINKDNPNDL